MFFTDIFKSGQFEEYRNKELIQIYQDYFDDVLSQRKKINYEYRRIKKREGDFFRTEKIIDMERTLNRFQEYFFKKISENVQTDKFVFISHYHKDLADTLDIICFLSQVYHIGAYVDCFDKRQPLRTSIATAIRIKEIIQRSHRFLFFATNGAIASKWCNWELGYGDSLMHSLNKKHLAFWALQNTAIKHGDFKGNEYMEMYPFIVYQPKSNDSDSNGYSVRIREKGQNTYIPLKEWLK